jgi:hypothetical protein
MLIIMLKVTPLKSGGFSDRINMDIGDGKYDQRKISHYS